MTNETFITVSLAEYKELLESKIKGEYEEKIRALEADAKGASENVDYWFNQYCKRNRELDEAMQQIAALKDRLSFYEPVKEGGEPENG